MRILGLDYGTKRIGVAISDPEQTVAFPRDIFQNNDLLLGRLKKLITEEKIVEIVVGWPLSLEGKETGQTRKTGAFIALLEESLDIPITKMDERWTTAQADRSGGDDAVAAQIILQNRLDVV
jgi:putative holliday junction resolvase